MIRCRDCSNLYELGRARRQPGYANGRKYYYCKILKRTNGWQSNFVGFGDTTYESPLKLKTSPRECPLRNREDEDYMIEWSKCPKCRTLNGQEHDCWKEWCLEDE